MQAAILLTAFHLKLQGRTCMRALYLYLHCGVASLYEVLMRVAVSFTLSQIYFAHQARKMGCRRPLRPSLSRLYDPSQRLLAAGNENFDTFTQEPLAEDGVMSTVRHVTGEV